MENFITLSQVPEDQQKNTMNYLPNLIAYFNSKVETIQFRHQIRERHVFHIRRTTLYKSLKE